MTPLYEVTKDVAEALGLRLSEDDEPYPFNTPAHYAGVKGIWLLKDGSNLTTEPYWRCACEDWLHERGRIFAGVGQETHEFEGSEKAPFFFEVACPWTEAPARLVSAVWQRLKQK